MARPKPPIIARPVVETDHRTQALDLICEIIAMAGSRFNGKTRLHKAFYAAHLLYWKEAQKPLTAYPIVKMPHGPGIDGGDDLIEELEATDRVRVERDNSGVYPDTTYVLMVAVQVQPDGPRQRAITQAVKWVQSRYATDLSNETHENSRSWQISRPGEELDIYLDLLTEEEYERLKEVSTRTDEAVERVFGGPAF